MMTLSMAMAKAASVPGRTRSQYAEREASQVSDGSMVIILEPRCMQSTIQPPKKLSEFETTALQPQFTMTSGQRQPVLSS